MKDDIIVDAITMAVSADGSAALETLKTIAWCTNKFGVKTVVGLSNVSFGLPERKWINASFMGMAIANGLTSAIANPESVELMSTKRASDVLAGRDKDAAAFIAHFSGSKDPSLAWCWRHTQEHGRTGIPGHHRGRQGWGLGLYQKSH